MTSTEDLRQRGRQLASRLDRRLSRQELHGVYLELSVLAGRLQGAVGEYARLRGETDVGREAESKLEQIKTSVRRVGLDIRLAPESALLMGMQLALGSIDETLDLLDGGESGGVDKSV